MRKYFVLSIQLLINKEKSFHINPLMATEISITVAQNCNDQSSAINGLRFVLPKYNYKFT